jgi:putative endonuclease
MKPSVARKAPAAFDEPAPSPKHLELGRLGEDMACRFLWKRGFRILERNFEGPRGEIDIIAEKNGRIRFVEVKTRSSDSLGAPEERVDKKKEAMLRETAQAYLERFRDAPPAGAQFDVVAQVVDPAKRRASEQTLIENAF